MISSKPLTCSSVTTVKLDQIIYKSSHDMRAPLMSILGLVNLARKTYVKRKHSACMYKVERTQPLRIMTNM